MAKSKSAKPFGLTRNTGLRLEKLETPEIRAALIQRLTPLLEKAPVLVLHSLCQTLEMLGDK